MNTSISLRTVLSSTSSLNHFLKRGAKLASFATCLGLALTIGCGPTTDTPDSDGTAAVDGEHDDHDSHDHGDHGDHDGHDHAGHSHEGKHGGHVVVLDPGHVHAEFVHLDEEEILEIYVDEIADKVTAVQVVVETAGQEAKTYDLEAAQEALGAGGYQIKNALLLTNIGMADGETNKVTLKVETADGTLTAPLMDDHGHDH